jgi:hypothetical protein
MKRNLQVGVRFKDFQERKVAILISVLENIVEVAHGLVVVKDQTKLNLWVAHDLDLQAARMWILTSRQVTLQKSVRSDLQQGPIRKLKAVTS